MLGNNSAPTQVRVLGQSAVAVPLTGSTSETTLATITIPAGAMGANGRVEIRAEHSYPNSANSKTLRIKFGGTTVFSGGATTTTSSLVTAYVANQSVSAQRFSASHLNSSGSLAIGSTAPASAAVDTTASVDIVITGQLALGSETQTLVSYQVILYPKG